MNIFLRIMGRLFGWSKDADRYFERFVRPSVEHGLAAGISGDRLSELWMSQILSASIGAHIICEKEGTR